MTEKTYTQSPWSLKELFDSFDDPKMNEAYIKLEKMVSQFEAHRECLKPDIEADTFLALIKMQEDFTTLAYRVYGFASLSFAANTQDQKAQIAMARFQQFAAEMGNRTLFFSLWWKALEEGIFGVLPARDVVAAIVEDEVALCGGDCQDSMALSVFIQRHGDAQCIGRQTCLLQQPLLLQQVILAIPGS